MTKLRSEILEDLRTAARMQYPVRVERDQKWWADDVLGFVVSVGDRWVVLQSLVEAVYFDGYDIIRIADITSVDDDREGGYIERAIAALGRPQVGFRLPDPDSTKSVLRAAADHTKFICVFLEAQPDYPLVIGHLERLGGRRAEIQIINPRGVWATKTFRCRYKDITRVEFGDRYSIALERFGDERPLR